MRSFRTSRLGSHRLNEKKSQKPPTNTDLSRQPRLRLHTSLPRSPRAVPSAPAQRVPALYRRCGLYITMTQKIEKREAPALGLSSRLTKGSLASSARG